jgi:hypothetical protein
VLNHLERFDDEMQDGVHLDGAFARVWSYLADFQDISPWKMTRHSATVSNGDFRRARPPQRSLLRV